MKHKFEIDDTVRVIHSRKGGTIIRRFYDVDSTPVYAVRYIGVNTRFELFREDELEVR